jgi:hypothetical protein
MFAVKIALKTAQALPATKYLGQLQIQKSGAEGRT